VQSVLATCPQPLFTALNLQLFGTHRKSVDQVMSNSDPGCLTTEVYKQPGSVRSGFGLGVSETCVEQWESPLSTIADDLHQIGARNVRARDAVDIPFFGLNLA